MLKPKPESPNPKPKTQNQVGLTGVRILEFDLLNFVNFEADINFAEDEGIVQVRPPQLHAHNPKFQPRTQTSQHSLPNPYY